MCGIAAFFRAALTSLRGSSSVPRTPSSIGVRTARASGCPPIGMSGWATRGSVSLRLSPAPTTTDQCVVENTPASCLKREIPLVLSLRFFSVIVIMSGLICLFWLMSDRSPGSSSAWTFDSFRFGMVVDSSGAFRSSILIDFDFY